MTQDKESILKPPNRFQIYKQACTRVLLVLAQLGGLACLCGSLAALLARFHWFCELFVNFPVQYAAGLLISGLLLFFASRHRLAVTFLLAAGWNLSQVLPVYLPAEQVNDTPATFRIVSSNVLTSNSQKELTLETLKQTSADVIFMFEIDERWETASTTLHESYPHHFTHPQQDNFGLACFSKQEFRRIELLRFDDWEIGALLVELEFENQIVTILAAHPLPPMRSHLAQQRNDYLSKLADLASKRERVVIVGDLNAAPYSPYFRKLLAEANLRDSRQGFGIQASWPADRWLLRIPIDHCLVSQDISVLDRQLLPNVGSDHLPIQIDLGIKSK